jgi:hypothetical protein
MFQLPCPSWPFFGTRSMSLRYWLCWALLAAAAAGWGPTLGLGLDDGKARTPPMGWNT